MNLVTVSLILVTIGTVVVLGNFYIYNSVADSHTATAEELAARLEIAYSSLQRDIDKLESLQQGTNGAGNLVAGAPSGKHETHIPAVVDCEGDWSAWGPCSMGCGVGSRSRLYQVTVVSHGPSGHACPHKHGEVDTRQCSALDCADISSSVLNQYCPGASCGAVVDNGYCDDEYGSFCATHDGLAQPLAPPPGYSAKSIGRELCPKSCQASNSKSDPRKMQQHKASSSGSSSNEKPSSIAAADLVAAVGRKVPSAASSSGAAAGLSEQQLVSAMEAVYPSDDVAAAGNYMGVHDPHVLELSDALGKIRAEKVKAAMKWNWEMYAKCAWGRDELLPATCGGQDNWGAFGFTLIDALDTLWYDFLFAAHFIAVVVQVLTSECLSVFQAHGLERRVPRSTRLGCKQFGFVNAKEQSECGWALSCDSSIHAIQLLGFFQVSLFECNIRVLGGLLAAYDLSGDAIFLEKGRELATRFFPAFETPTGLPYPSIVVSNGRVSNTWTGDDSLLVCCCIAAILRRTYYDMLALYRHYHRPSWAPCSWNFDTCPITPRTRRFARRPKEFTKL